MEQAAEASNCRVVAAASRDLERAAQFASVHGTSRAYGSYDELLEDRDIEAVYVAVPNSLHHAVTMRALAAGKHVLAEKPYSRRPGEVVEGFDAAGSRGLLLMEALMWRHSPQTRR